MSVNDDWDDFIVNNYPGAILIKSAEGIHHRVYKYHDKAIKVQYRKNNYGNFSVKNEYKIICRTCKYGYNFMPNYIELESGWNILEMRWVDGPLLDEVVSNKLAGEISILSLISLIARLSMSGVVHRQLRARHIIKSDNKLVLIDYGGSRLSYSLQAMLINFFPLRVRNNKIEIKPYIWLIKKILEQRYR